MSPVQQDAIEFLQFIADISDAGTGAVSLPKLAARLGMSNDALRGHWMTHGRGVSWKYFANKLIDTLDQAQRRTHDLPSAIAWYRGEAALDKATETSV